MVIQKPILSGSEFMNYKSTFSIVFFALVDVNYNLLSSDIGSQGRISNGSIFKDDKKSFTFTTTDFFRIDRKMYPIFFISDNAFAVSENLLNLFQDIFPKKLSKVER